MKLGLAVLSMMVVTDSLPGIRVRDIRGRIKAHSHIHTHSVNDDS